MWPKIPRLDIRNGILLACLAIIIYLSFHTRTTYPVVIKSNFFPGQIASDINASARFSGNWTGITGSRVEAQDIAVHQIQEREFTLHDGVTQFIREDPQDHSDLVILVLTKDAASWGHDYGAPPRVFHDFLDLLISTQLDLAKVSLGLWTTSVAQYHLFRVASSRLPFARVSIFLEPDNNSSNSLPRKHRHNPDPAVQTARRGAIAQLRNSLMLHSLKDESHLLWIDADVQYFSPGIVQRMLSHSESKSDAGILTARCQDGPTMYDYDKNAWAGGRPRPEGQGEEDLWRGREEQAPTRELVGKLIEGTGDDDLIRLDSVGGTILLIRTSLLWKGLTFPTTNVIGTGWGVDGWDGIETEGLCYLARQLEGAGCFVLGGENHVKHTS